MKPYLIVTPPYVKNCAGIKVLHHLAHLLNTKGHKAYVTSRSNPEYLTYNFKDIPKNELENIIVVYPEIVAGNPLKAGNVVRWDLNKPIHAYLETDLAVAYNEVIMKYSKATELLTIYCIEDFFRPPETENRTKKCFWVGKGRGTPEIAETKDAIEITHSWPSDRRELARLFQEGCVFYSYDNFTVLIDEARLCGCPVVVIPSGQITLDDFKDSTLGIDGISIYGVSENRNVGEVKNKYNEYEKRLAGQLDNFILKSQALNNKYQGDYQEPCEEWKGWIPNLF